MSWQDEYNESIARAFLRLRGEGDWPEWIQEHSDGEAGIAAFLLARINQNLVLFLIHMEQRFETEDVEEITRAVRMDFARLSLTLEVIGRASVDDAVNGAREAHLEGIRNAVAAVGANTSIAIAATESFAGFRRVVQQRAQRIGFSTDVQGAIRANVVVAAQVVDQFIRRSVQEGVQNIAQQIIQGILGNDERAIGLYRQLGGRHREVGRAVGRLKAGLGKFTNASSLASDIRRNILYGVSAMHHEAMVYGYSLSPMVGALRWRTSHRHKEPDACDLVARSNVYGLGSGLYYPEVCCGLIHPYCGCLVEPVYRNPSEWSEPKPEPTEPTLVTGTLDLSPKRRSRAIAMANQSIIRAHREWQRFRRAA